MGPWKLAGHWRAGTLGLSRASDHAAHKSNCGGHRVTRVTRTLAMPHGRATAS
jgi:hypothetical protein